MAKTSVSNRRTAIMAGFVGNVVEWYDFALYGYMASVLSTLYFPSENHVASMLATYGAFAAGFLMRPLGSAVFGWLGDTIGRSKTMLLSVSLMFLPTLAIGVLPGYEVIGLAAPILLVLIRLVQGLSVGGEFSSSVTYLVETAARDHRGRSGSWANQGAIAGMTLGAGLAALVSNVFPDQVLHDWAWRLPFLFGGVIGGVAILLRRHLGESPAFTHHQAHSEPRSPLKMAFTRHRMEMLQATALASVYGVFFYIPMVYLPNWIATHTGMGLDVAMRLNLVALLLVAPLIYLSAWVGDCCIQRTRWIMMAFIAAAVSTYPVLMMLTSENPWLIGLGQWMLLAFLAVPLGAAPTVFVEMFPPEDRLTGYSISYNIGLGVIGGTTPMVATWLIDVSGNRDAVFWMLGAACLLGVGIMAWIRDRSRATLHQPRGVPSDSPHGAGGHVQQTGG